MTELGTREAYGRSGNAFVHPYWGVAEGWLAVGWFFIIVALVSAGSQQRFRAAMQWLKVLTVHSPAIARQLHGSKASYVVALDQRNCIFNFYLLASRAPSLEKRDLQ